MRKKDSMTLKRTIPDFLKPFINKKLTFEQAKGLCFRAFDGRCDWHNCAVWMDYVCLCDFKTGMTPHSVGASVECT